MGEVVYKDKFFASSLSYSALSGQKYKKVSTCPYCGIGTDATQVNIYQIVITNGVIANASYKCTSCDKVFHVSYLKLEDEDEFKPFSVYPNFQGRIFSKEIVDVSPRFIKLYNQPYKAEYDNNFELAGSGYRNALEILIKDYAINVLKENRKAVIKTKLYDAISKYIPDVDMSNCADVVRILGNDNTHYERDYESIDFNVLKQYLNIFIDMIDVTIKVKNPPVSRNSK